jgi:hypothetical protein
MATSTYNLIASQVVGSGGAASVTFSSIPGTYTDLLIKASARSTDSGGSSMYLRFNSDSGSYYSDKILLGNGSSASSSSSSSIAQGGYAEVTTNNWTANTFSNSEFYIPSYTSTNNKSFSVDSVAENNATTAIMNLSASLYAPPTNIAITSIAILAIYGSTPYNFTQYSTFYLYGIKNS